MEHTVVRYHGKAWRRGTCPGLGELTLHYLAPYHRSVLYEYTVGSDGSVAKARSRGKTLGDEVQYSTSTGTRPCSGEDHDETGVERCCGYVQQRRVNGGRLTQPGGWRAAVSSSYRMKLA